MAFVSTIRTLDRPRPHSLSREIPIKRQHVCKPVRVIELDFSDPDTQLGAAGLLLGLVAGIGAPLWYINRVEKDQDRLEELRALNRANFEATGEYMTDEEITKMRKPKWTDRREWQDDD
ncbi:hypothetical protein CEUSTIGMA_g12733.t1 [Chlamydomonas eustigma]|uniref:Uncharacterized protein n=1 Tax=Chlamydomonas eustigma TaxID=1157962 RepID=A0A250XQJ1_9CHLO|nr:hypothetical protein CEUSTIGMA_g12733.t1 [Chlamydomonas eustigma]|eukprot:GAX85316.1 hypothetical protein CEUSTIGMA_g12733.t1 [Chlamydomonas eustigma]